MEERTNFDKLSSGLHEHALVFVSVHNLTLHADTEAVRETVLSKQQC